MMKKFSLIFMVILIGMTSCTSDDGDSALYYVQQSIRDSGTTWNGDDVVDRIIVEPIYRDGQPILQFTGEKETKTAQEVDRLLKENGVPSMNSIQRVYKHIN